DEGARPTLEGVEEAGRDRQLRRTSPSVLLHGLSVSAGQSPGIRRRPRAWASVCSPNLPRPEYQTALPDLPLSGSATPPCYFRIPGGPIRLAGGGFSLRVRLRPA